MTGSEPTPAKFLVKRLFDDHPSGKFQEIIRAGYAGLDDNDLPLAMACSNHVLARAETGSGDMMRAMLLQARVYEQTGKEHRAVDLMNAVIQERF